MLNFSEKNSDQKIPKKIKKNVVDNDNQGDISFQEICRMSENYLLTGFKVGSNPRTVSALAPSSLGADKYLGLDPTLSPG